MSTFVMQTSAAEVKLVMCSTQTIEINVNFVFFKQKFFMLEHAGKVSIRDIF